MAGLSPPFETSKRRAFLDPLEGGAVGKRHYWLWQGSIECCCCNSRKCYYRIHGECFKTVFHTLPCP